MYKLETWDFATIREKAWGIKTHFPHYEIPPPKEIFSSCTHPARIKKTPVVNMTPPDSSVRQNPLLHLRTLV